MQDKVSKPVYRWTVNVVNDTFRNTLKSLYRARKIGEVYKIKTDHNIESLLKQALHAGYISEYQLKKLESKDEN